jgi:hypothetical protein
VQCFFAYYSLYIYISQDLRCQSTNQHTSVKQKFLEIIFTFPCEIYSSWYFMLFSHISTKLIPPLSQRIGPIIWKIYFKTKKQIQKWISKQILSIFKYSNRKNLGAQWRTLLTYAKVIYYNIVYCFLESEGHSRKNKKEVNISVCVYH